MRQAAKRGLLTVIATGSAIASTAGYAYADASATGAAAGSPGVASGNTVQAPVNVPVNICGDTINVVGLLNPAYGNHCGNGGSGHGGSGGGSVAGGGGSGRSAGAGSGSGSSHGSGGSGGSGGSAGHSGSGQAGSGSRDAGGSGLPGLPGFGSGGSSATGTSSGSAGLLSGNTLSAPVSVPLNACGDSVNVVGAGNPAFGNDCGNAAHPEHCSCTPPSTPQLPPPPKVQAASTPQVRSVPAGAVLASTGSGDSVLLAPLGIALAAGGVLLYRRNRRTAGV